MKRAYLGVITAATTAAVVAFAGCSSDADDCANTNSCGPYTGNDGSAASGGSGGAAGVGATGGTSGASGGGGTSASGGTSGSAGTDGGMCDPSKSPSEDSCVIDEQYGVFVDAGSAASAPDGTQAAPYKTIGAALSAAGGKRIYVCNTNGDYAESVSITAASDGVEIFGGFDCAGWGYSTGGKARVVSASDAVALTVDGLTTGARFEDLEFASSDATAAGGSSVAAFVKNSMGVVFTRVDLTAGKGVKGADGTRTDFVYPSQMDLNGLNGTTIAGAMTKTCTCPSGMTSGGGGGGPGSGGQSGFAGLPALGAGQAGTPGSCGGTGTGKDGNPAQNRTRAVGAAASGAISASGWTPGAGDDGQDGAPGQGGGGGASNDASGGAGGGGCGGCGGAGGKAGQGGGGSIALLSLSSSVALTDCNLTTGDAGDGGKGTLGQQGQQNPGFGGDRGSPAACTGGSGGKGGNGGAAGGGAGGISVPIVYKGTLPTTTNVMQTAGVAGAKGPGGNAGMNDGVDGVSQTSPLEVL